MGLRQEQLIKMGEELRIFSVPLLSAASCETAGIASQPSTGDLALPYSQPGTFIKDVKNLEDTLPSHLPDFH